MDISGLLEAMGSIEIDDTMSLLEGTLIGVFAGANIACALYDRPRKEPKPGESYAIEDQEFDVHHQYGSSDYMSLGILEDAYPPRDRFTTPLVPGEAPLGAYQEARRVFPPQMENKPMKDLVNPYR